MKMYLKEGLHLQPNTKINKSHQVFKFASNADASSFLEGQGGSVNKEGNQSSAGKDDQDSMQGPLYDHGSLKEANINRNTVKRIKKLLVMNNPKY